MFVEWLGDALADAPSSKSISPNTSPEKLRFSSCSCCKQVSTSAPLAPSSQETRILGQGPSFPLPHLPPAADVQAQRRVKNERALLTVVGGSPDGQPGP